MADSRHDKTKRLPLVDKHVRPKTRGDCKDVPRPCPFIGCIHNLWLLSITPKRGELRPRTPQSPERIDPKSSCVLDIVEENPDGMTLDDVAEKIGLTRERIRQIEAIALEKTSENAWLADLYDYDKHHQLSFFKHPE